MSPSCLDHSSGKKHNDSKHSCQNYTDDDPHANIAKPHVAVQLLCAGPEHRALYQGKPDILASHSYM